MAANYEMLYVEKRSSLYSLIRKYEHNLINHNVKTVSKSKLRKLIREEFDTSWQSQIHTFPTKADT